MKTAPSPLRAFTDRSWETENGTSSLTDPNGTVTVAPSDPVTVTERAASGAVDVIAPVRPVTRQSPWVVIPAELLNAA